MEENFTALETLLNTNSSFLQNASLFFTQVKEDKSLSYNEQLAEACWNGDLAAVLPEIFFNNNLPNMYLWQVSGYNNIIMLESASIIHSFKNSFSINPYHIDLTSAFN